MWLGGQQPSKDDAEAFNSLNECPDADTHPNASAWYSLVSRFTESVRNSWTATSAAAPSGGKKGKDEAKAAKKQQAKAAKQEQPKPAAAAAEESKVI